LFRQTQIKMEKKFKVEIKNRFTGKIIFEYNSSKNNLRDANLRGANLRDADLCGANLRDADLRDANLRGADLRGANLRGADLCGANLRDANLRDANLRGADLRGADLRGADLCGANLRGADLCGADLRDAIKLPLYCRWNIGITKDLIHIGCKKMTIEEWDKFFNSDEEFETNRGTEEFIQIQACYEAYKSYLTFLNNNNIKNEIF